MKTFTLIDETFLREKNPLENNRGLLSSKAYAAHELLYIENAIVLLNPVPGKIDYTAEDLEIGWQFKDGESWIEISEPNFIQAEGIEYRQFFRVRNFTPPCFQVRTADWLVECFGETLARDRTERCFRLVEEVFELVQSLGFTKEQILKQLAYTYYRPQGDTFQETGGVMVTLAALCFVTGHDMNKAGEAELLKNKNRIEYLREKQKTRIS